jgi:hypothetical protein
MTWLFMVVIGLALLPMTARAETSYRAMDTYRGNAAAQFSLGGQTQSSTWDVQIIRSPPLNLLDKSRT